MKRFASVIIDIKASKAMNNNERFDAQEKLYKIINIVNNLYQRVLVKALDFSAGDSIQGLFENTRNAFNAYLLIKNLFYPYDIRCGLGYSVVDLGMVNDLQRSTNRVDGKAYHLAQQAITQCKKNKSDFMIFSDFAKDDILINQIMRSAQFLTSKQTPSQADICNLLNLLYPVNYHDLCIDTNKYCGSILDFMQQNVENYVFENYSTNMVLYEDMILEIYRNTRENQKDEQNMDYAGRCFFDNLFPSKIDNILAAFVGTTRQNIAKQRISSASEEIRRLELCAISYLEKIYDKGD